ncbi:M1 family aminopeptidase, partial [Saprospiraceae bacterium]|nr:M1 family aminopeptidase [Saprospiraceae bacterium]
LVNDIDRIELDLLDLNIDSILVDGVSMDFTYDGFQLYVGLGSVKQPGDDFDVEVFYHGIPTRDDSNFGGLVTEAGYIYNLGIGIAANPHNFGRGWFPCFDNFMERSTYEYNVTHASGLSAHCVGTEIGIVDNGDGTKTTSYAMDQLITTYQSSIAISTYTALWSEHEGVAGTIPIKLISKTQDTSKMKTAFGNLTGAIDAIEFWYGPDVWERVGFVITTVGAMEHPTNIAYPVAQISGNANANTRLVSHELTHNWFGNMVTLSTERDMWIKEGPAEYGYHLTTEHIFGKEEFLEVVKDNHEFVLERAHIDDDIFRALSGMPNEFTYGTHTYRKGASVIHNLRGYLGDDLFKVGMRSILENYVYSHLDADQFRDQVTEATGVDMTDFFDAWIFNPGFSVFVEDSVKSVDNGDGTFTHDIYIQQKLRGTSIYHKSVPLQFHTYGTNGEQTEHSIMASNQYDQVSVNTNYPIERVVFNRDNLLNQSRMAEDITLENVENYTFSRTGLTLKVKEIEEAMDVRVEHIWAAPDNNMIEGDIELSEGHYWRIQGVEEDAPIAVNFIYDGSNERDFDFNLVEFDEDSLFLMYRPDASFAWAPYEGHEHSKIIPTDGKGLMKVENLNSGEYTFGRGEALLSNSTEIDLTSIAIHPNPVLDKSYVYMEDALPGEYRYELMDISGNVVQKGNFTQREYFEINASDIAAGQYVVKLKHKESGKLFVDKLVVIK